MRAENWARGREVPSSSAEVFYAVAALAEDTRGVVCDEERLCARAEVSPSELVTTLDELEEYGLLVWEQTMAGRLRIELRIGLDMSMPSALRMID